MWHLLDAPKVFFWPGPWTKPVHPTTCPPKLAANLDWTDHGPVRIRWLENPPFMSEISQHCLMTPEGNSERWISYSTIVNHHNDHHKPLWSIEFIKYCWLAMFCLRSDSCYFRRVMPSFGLEDSRDIHSFEVAVEILNSSINIKHIISNR